MKKDTSKFLVSGDNGSMENIFDGASKKFFEAYLRQGNLKRSIKKIILTGNSSQSKDIGEYCEKLFNIKTYFGNPWGRVKYSKELTPVLKDISPQFAVAVGTAMKALG